MQKLNKNELIDLVAEKSYINKRDAKAAVDATFEIIEKALVNGKEVNISNFGSFVPTVTKKRIGTNPRTHEKMILPEKNDVSFKLSKTIKNKIN